MTVEPSPAALDFSVYWAALQARYAPLLVDRLGLDAPLRDVAQYALAGGKLLRPLFVELVGRAVGAPPAALTEIAIAVEYLHTASVLLDDLPCMDDASARRGRPPAHVRFSEAEAILTAVALTSRSYSLLLATPVDRPHVNQAMARLACDTVAGAMAVGQAIELGCDASASPERVRSIHEHKTASLFGLAGSLAAAAGVANPSMTEPLVRCATLVGRAYQILDDIEDRHDRVESSGNLARAVGTPAAATEARELLDAARRAVADVHGADGLRACVEWFERRLDGAS